MISPLVLHGTVLGLTLGQKRSLTDEKSLVNPSNDPMLVDELRFAVVTTYEEGSLGYEYNDMSLAVRAKIEIDRIPLTADYVPITLLGRYINEPAAQYADSPDGINKTYVKRYRWRFSKPLFIPAGKKIEVSIWYASPWIDNPALDFHITAVGRSLGANFAQPSSIYIPYAAQWIVPTITPGAGAVFESTEGDLANPFKRPFNIRSLHIEPGGATENASALNHSPFTGAMVRDLRMRIVDHRGNVIVRDEVPLAAIAPTIDYSWPMNATLVQGGFWKSRLKVLATNLDVTEFGMSLLGFYEHPFAGTWR